MHARELDPRGSPLDYYGYELRRTRETACLTQQALGVSPYAFAALLRAVGDKSR